MSSISLLQKFSMSRRCVMRNSALRVETGTLGCTSTLRMSSMISRSRSRLTFHLRVLSDVTSLVFELAASLVTLPNSSVLGQR